MLIWKGEITLKDQNPKITEFLEELTKDKFEISVNEAFDKGLCVNCLEPAIPKCYSGAGLREYEISGLCEKCFDDLFDY